MTTDTPTSDWQDSDRSEPANTLPPFGVTTRDIDAVLLATPDNPVWHGGYCEIARLAYDQIAHLADHCWDCSRTFDTNNTSIVIARSDEGGDDPYDSLRYVHTGCWVDHTTNWRQPTPIPDGPVTWWASGPRPGRVTEGNIDTNDGTVTILVHGEPLLGFDLHAGTVFTWPDGEEHLVVGRFTPVP